MTANNIVDFNYLEPSLTHGLVVEASAGTGKTFSVAAVLVHALATREDLRIGDILVTTFTRNAAAELRDRVRRRLVSVEQQLRSGVVREGDDLAAQLVTDEAPERAERLARAVRDFDSATIATIHSVCARILTLAGLATVGDDADAQIDDIIAEVVNDHIVMEALQGRQWDPSRVTTIVEAVLGSPRSVLDFVAPKKDADAAAATLEELRRVVVSVVDAVRQRTARRPTFDDMVRRTADLLGDPTYRSITDAVRARFSLAIIDEAQDTDALQWEIFSRIFTGEDSSRALVAVGDPKQAIYRFRGADVQAYLSVRDDANMRTLRQNWRSDSGLIDALNVVFDQWQFGPRIDYLTTLPRPKAPVSQVSGVVPFTVVQLPPTNSNGKVVRPAAQRVSELLSQVTISDEGVDRPLVPKDVCVLVRSKMIGRAIETELRALGITAVSSGTESVMDSEMADALRRLIEAMAAPFDMSRARLAASSVLFGYRLADAAAMDDDALDAVQQTIGLWSLILRREGVAALAASIHADPHVLDRIVAGQTGERRETDFAHVVELLHASTRGVGCTPEEVLEVFEELAGREATAETVSRRVESDRDAVQIMTVHASKGLEFPVVVVADLWKLSRNRQGVPVYHRSTGGDNKTERVIDITYAVHKEPDQVKAARVQEEEDEVRRLFYVALTRARHHVSLVAAPPQPSSKGVVDTRATTTPHNLFDASLVAQCPEYIEIVRGTRAVPYAQAKATPASLSTALIAPGISQVYWRTSFSGITRTVQGRQRGPVEMHDTSGNGRGDDDDPVMSFRHGYASFDVPLGVEAMPLARVPGGTYFGTVMHSVYENIDFAADLSREVPRVVDKVVQGSLHRLHRDDIIAGVTASLQTPLGPAFDERTLSTFTATDRLNELNFEMSLAALVDGVTVSALGTRLIELLPEGDLMRGYAEILARPMFEVPLAGLMSGSIDTVLRVSSDDASRLWVVDYKTNRLDVDGVSTIIDGYTRESMWEEMVHHHYPLQALIYGTCLYRYVRWRSPRTDADAAVAGFSYLFVRGMVGEKTPRDRTSGGEMTSPRGVMTWSAPAGLWSGLSETLSAVRT